MKDLTDVIKPEFMQLLANAISNNKLGLLVVVTDEMIRSLASNQATGSTLDDGGAVILVPQAAIEKVYK